MLPDQQRLSSDDRSNLVAFLDGELNDAQARSIATKLTQSVTARREVDALQKTWEMLDLLDRPRASEDFSARTMTFADKKPNASDLVATAASEVTRKVGMILAWLVASTLLFILGYVGVSRVWPDPTARLTRDLPIAESLDEYLDAGTIEFLDKIDKAPEFN